MRRVFWSPGMVFPVALAVAALLFAVLPARGGVPGFMRARMGILAGTVVLPAGEAMPADGLIVAFFDRAKGPPPTEMGMHRVPEMVVRSRPDGGFSVALLPGTYNIGVLNRPRGVGPGPPRPGEKFFFAMDEGGKLAGFQVRTREKSDAGRIAVARPAEIKELAEFVTVKGRVFDESGKPFAGALVLVKDNPRTARPLFIAAPSDEEGNYHIKLPPNTTYYLLARQSIQGGRPMPGTYVGTFGKHAPTQGTGQEAIGGPAGVAGSGGEGEALPVRGEPGQVIDHVDITMFPVPDPEANRKKYQKTPATPAPAAAAGQ